jgi:hypothetical protein
LVGGRFKSEFLLALIDFVFCKKTRNGFFLVVVTS